MGEVSSICTKERERERQVKSGKRCPLPLVHVLLAVLCGAYVISFCVAQTSFTFRLFPMPMPMPMPTPTCLLLHTNHSHLHFPTPKSFNREECGCNPVRSFVIVSMQRSGSGWFESLLNNHTNITSNGEIFSVKQRRTNISTIFQTMDQVYNLDWSTSASKNECTAAVGFKWMLNQGLMANYKEIADYLNNKGVSIIFLLRRNQLRRMVSVLANSHDKKVKLLNGIHQSHVHSSHEAKILATYKPKINATQILQTLMETKETIAKALQYFNSTRHMIIYYEDIFSNHMKLGEVQSFLELPYRQLSSQQVKIHTSPLLKQIENWDDIQKALNGTSFEHFLHADY